MRVRSASTTVGVCLALATSVAAQPVRVPLDQETTVGDIPVACTGIGQTKNDPKWLAYPVRVEFADAEHAYLADETISLADAHGHQLLDVACEGPWILLKLPPRVAYRVEGRLRDPSVPPVSATVKAPSHGQTRFVLTFPVNP